MRELRFVCAQPAIPYYTWQVEVMIHNFIEMGINPNQMDIVCWKQNNVIPDDWLKLANHYNYVRFFFYDDTRETRHYISSIRPNILKQHWAAHPELEKSVIFYHDNDIAFTKPINWDQFMHDEKWYGSDVRWYISHDYIIKKGEDVLDQMCKIVDIDKQVVKDNEMNCIGAQTLIKNIDYNFWDTVERNCEKLFKDITDLNNQKIEEDKKKIEEEVLAGKPRRAVYHEVQIWCADMWSLLWNGWKRGVETVCHEDLQFSWGTSSEQDWFKYNIYHNAGVINEKTGLFYKALYMNKTPYNENLSITPNTASWHYWQNIQKTAKKSILI